MPGLSFCRLDLHTHTPASRCYSYPDHTPQQIVQKAIDLGLAAIGVTDHNTAAWIESMQHASAETGLIIFPGVEISMSEGYHLVALFDPCTDQKHVESFLGAIDIRPEDYGRPDALCTKGVYDVIKKVHERQGLAVLAHIDRPKGAFREQAKPRENGKIGVPLPCSKLFNEAEYDAAECTDGHLPDGFDATHQLERFPAIYQASDNPDPQKPSRHSLDGMGSLYSWFKLDQINLEGLRQCFADPEVRIRPMGDNESVGYPKVVSMRIGDSGFLRNQVFEFHGGLNSIIGGKGVGKSLAVEFLRFALGQTSSDVHLCEDLVSKLDKRLGVGNTVEVLYQTADGDQYRIERTYAGSEKRTGGPSARNQCKCTNLAIGSEYSGDVPALLPILAYSQTEVIKIAENKEAQLELIDRFIDTRLHERQIEEVQELLDANDKELSQAFQASYLLASCDLQIATLSEKIAAINRTLADPLFDAMRAAETKKQTFENQQTYVHGLGEEVSGWLAEIVGLAIEPLPETCQDDVELGEQQTRAEAARLRAKKVLDDLLSGLAADEESIGTALANWLPHFEQVTERYTALLQTIGGDREAQEAERKRMEGEKAELEKKARTLRADAEELPNLLRDREGVLDRLEEAHRDYFEVRQAKFAQLAELSGGKLMLELGHAEDRTEYETKLSSLLKGSQNSLHLADRRRIAESISPRRLVSLVLDRDAAQIADEAGITELWAGRVVEKLWSRDDFIEVLALQHNCYPADVPSIRFRKDDNHYDELNELSVGQKCTALLIIALCDGRMPVVIDQPEDALDIISVWEDIAKKLRRGKDSRQFILTTHNSSVAVAADSDQFIVLTADASQGRVAAAGAIDREDVRDAVIKHLEGGDEPYRLRLRKYNIV